MEAKKKKDVYKICVESPGGPCYYVYKEGLAQQLKAKLDKEWGQEFRIIMKKHNMEVPQENR